MRISVVIPVLNEERNVGQRLHELDALGPWEIIVVDGGSTDATQAIATGYPGVRLLSAPRGRASQMNAGATIATGEVLLFLHADVTLPSDALLQIRLALGNSEAVAGAFRTWTIADRSTRLGWLLHLADLRSRYSSLPYGDQAMFVRRSVFHALGGFPAIPLMEDLAMSKLLRTAGRVHILPTSVRVSGRRFIERPIYYTLLVNLFPLLHWAGVPPEVLARFYHHVQ